MSILLPPEVVTNAFELNTTHCALLIPAAPALPVAPCEPELPVNPVSPLIPCIP